ncbi:MULTISPECIES: ADP/ATP-dependent (S)-NAD(P)H-hydrate dehydratase [Microbacterium]|uniref:ADP-dependent NAD(P)H-hydrate dehydratase n=1 Tax=Microbacterium TaxID=33882 RepID=UPI00277DA569|nr:MULTISPECIES: ADP/ATP-dependent (S)-NAD(P)H-hydrate dehydratase [Microbacterium]MDQ1083122.1 ADP-dependent NAD(P)H-hydrate dehydratase [Microbacterium sp. SORGH_AS_0344]MDQ1171606.1 ADP-dependent NAD(P)H-hydrate dehydratase [Microbacterium proteolyticum]
MSEPVTLQLLREWGLPDAGGSKKSRGQVVVVGGSPRSPGAVLLSAEASLRVGAGRVGLAVPAELAPQLGPAMPEAGVYGLPAGSGPLDDALRSALESADAVLLGPGFDDPDATRAALQTVADADIDRLVLDAFALGILPTFDRGILPTDLLINANEEEAALLLERDLGDDREADVADIARRYDAVVHCFGTVAHPDGRCWQAEPGGSGLGTAGSGDVLSGAITGFAALGMDAERAAVWGGWTHARAGDRLTERLGVGFLARDLLPELTAVVHES